MQLEIYSITNFPYSICHFYLSESSRGTCGEESAASVRIRYILLINAPPPPATIVVAYISLSAKNARAARTAAKLINLVAQINGYKSHTCAIFFVITSFLFFYRVFCLFCICMNKHRYRIVFLVKTDKL